MDNEPGALVGTILSQLIDRVKSSKPLRTDGKSLTTGFVYSQLVLGEMIDPNQYKKPWSPMGGSSLQDTVNTVNLNPTTPPQDGNPSVKNADPKVQKAMEAAFMTSQLVDTQIMVTNDDSYVTYPGDKHISFAYEGIINGMQPTPMPPIAADVQKQIDDAKKILYKMDDDGAIIGKSDLYKTYQKNALAYATAKATFAQTQALTISNPNSTIADSWPLISSSLQQAVDNAWDDFKTEGAEQIERALDIIESVGVSMQDFMIAKARKIYDAWNVNIAGVAEKVPYSYISPTGWYDPDDDDEGWEALTVSESEYHSFDNKFNSYHWFNHSEIHSSSGSGGGGLMIFGFGGSGGGGSTSSESSGNSNSGSTSNHVFHNDAKGLSIQLEYGLCQINRPWLIGDLFYMNNWYLVNNTKNAISDGTVNGQVLKKEPLLPMLPTQFLVVRNVKITATTWGRDSDTLTNIYNESKRNSNSDSDYQSGGGGFSLGFLSIDGGGSHSSFDAQSTALGSGSSNTLTEYGFKFDGQTLEIRGAQIVAWLSDILPSCAPLDDPGLAKK